MRRFDEGDVQDCRDALKDLWDRLEDNGTLPGSSNEDLLEIADKCREISLLWRLAREREQAHIRNAFNCGRLKVRTL